jgi:putative ABC transport system permease protein
MNTAGKSLQRFAADLKFGWRMLRKNPGFASVAILTLALGIGANTVFFSVLNAVLLRPLPYERSARLAFISGTDPDSTESPGPNLSFPKFEKIESGSSALAGVSAFYSTPMNLITQREAEPVAGAHSSLNFFAVLGVTPVQGRTFLPEEEKLGGADVAIISDRFWRSHFAAGEDAVGRTLNLDGTQTTIVGVLPPAFQFPFEFPEPDLWLARVFEHPLLKPSQIQIGAGYLSVIARLRDGQTIAKVQAELNILNSQYNSEFAGRADTGKYGLSATSLQDHLIGNFRQSLVMLLTAVSLVLLIACANVTNLLLARSTTREKEIALRKTLGATRGRLTLQLLTESLLLSLIGGALGIVLAAFVMPLLRSFSPSTLPRLAQAGLDLPVLIFSFLISVLTGILFGLAPAIRTSAKNLSDSINEGTHGSAAGRSRGRSQAALIIGEVGLALMLLTSAGLLLESFARLIRVDPGFSAQNLMTFSINLPSIRYPQRNQQAQFYRQLVERVQNFPGIQGVGLVSYLPLSGAVRMSYFCAEGQICRGLGKDPLIAFRQVDKGYFTAIGTRLLRGRTFNSGDSPSGLPVMVVNETTARNYWPGENPIGKHMAGSRDLLKREVVGMVADVKYNTLNSPNLEELYIPFEQMPWPAMTLLVRSAGNQQALATAVRAKVAELDSGVPITRVSSMKDIVGTSLAEPRLILEFVSAFAAFALLLASIGLYGVMSYSVAARKREIGIRVSVGATPKDIFTLILSDGLKVTAIGIAIGLCGSFALTPMISSLLFGVRAADPLAFSVAALALIFAALLACYVPARRAIAVDPVSAIRAD